MVFCDFDEANTHLQVQTLNTAVQLVEWGCTHKATATAQGSGCSDVVIDNLAMDQTIATDGTVSKQNNMEVTAIFAPADLVLSC